MVTKAATETKATAKPKTGKAPAAVKAKSEAKPTGKKQYEGKTIKLTQVTGSIARQSDQRATLIGLGLNKRHRTRELMDTPEIRGMIYKVRHLLKVEESN
jgi:large subunit ribosomal protein L30